MSAVQLSLPLAAEAPKGTTTRYAAFLRAYGYTLADQSILTNVEFMIWCRRKWAEWGKAFGRIPQALTEADHAHFDAWLTKGGTQ